MSFAQAHECRYATTDTSEDLRDPLTTSRPSSVRSTLVYQPPEDGFPGALISIPARRHRYQRQGYTQHSDIQGELYALRDAFTSHPSKHPRHSPPPYSLQSRRTRRRRGQPVEIQPRRPASQLARPPPADYDYLQDVHAMRRWSEGTTTLVVVEGEGLSKITKEKSAFQEKADGVLQPRTILTFSYEGEKAFIRAGLSYDDARHSAIAAGTPLPHDSNHHHHHRQRGATAAMATTHQYAHRRTRGIG